jgi:hypothetical protein
MIGACTLESSLPPLPALYRRKRKKNFWNTFVPFSRELGELDARWTDEAWGCVGRRWTLGTALDRRRLARTAAALLNGSA